MHQLLVFQRSERLAKDLRGAGVERHGDTIVHPLPVPPDADDSGTTQISEVARDFGLRTVEHLDEIANADLLISHEVKKPEPGLVTQRLEEAFEIELRFLGHQQYIRIDKCISQAYSRLCRYVRQRGKTMSEKLLESVKARYGAIAESSLSSENAGVRAVAEAFGYTAKELTSIPAEANMGLSCGNPTATAHLKPGEVVVDLGSGGGLDVFLAAQKVGPTGRAIGIDMTSEMIARARANAEAGGYTNVEFYHSTIDKIPLPDASVDCVISNCVINLAPDKPAVFREIFRVLKPGGRVAVSDIALKADLPKDILTSIAAYTVCIAGAIKIEDYRNDLLKAGFQYVEIVDSGADLNVYKQAASCCSTEATDTSELVSLSSQSCCGTSPQSVHDDLSSLLATFDVNLAAASVKVYAIKPAETACCGPTCCDKKSLQ